jgi:hypothetical protein
MAGRWGNSTQGRKEKCKQPCGRKNLKKEEILVIFLRKIFSLSYKQEFTIHGSSNAESE